MLKNYLKVAFRNLIRSKSFSVINISGLAIGMAGAVLILLWIQNEISYDRFHKNGDRLYQVWENETIDGKLQSWTWTQQLLGPSLKNTNPGIEDAARMGTTSNLLFKVGDNVLKSAGTWADPAFLTMFSFPLVEGNTAVALKDPSSIVITQKLARKLFGDTDPMGKAVKLENADNFIVTGVLKDLPNNTAFDFEWLNSAAFMESKHYIDSDWTNVSIRTYVLLKPQVSADAVTANVKNIVLDNSGNRAKSTVFLYPVSQTRLYGEFENGKPSGGRIAKVRIFAIIAAFILLIACINFMNLSTARSEKRAKEVGIRKVTGALKRTLIFQFIGESVFISAIAAFVALVLVQLSLPVFNELTGKILSLDYHNLNFWIATVLFVAFTGLLAGSYPAFYLSSFRPVAVLKGTFKKVNALVTPRKVLVVLQFTIAVGLIICTIIVAKQIRYASGRSVGYSQKDLLYVGMDGDIFKNYQLIKNELINSHIATNVSQTLSPITQVWSAGNSMQWKGKEPDARIDFVRSSTNGDLVKTAGLTLVAGRDIDPVNFPSDSTACLINEAAVKATGFADPIGQQIFDDPTGWHIVGVVKDFIVESPYNRIKPIIFKGPRMGRNVMHIRLNDQQPTETNLAQMEKIFKKYNPAYPFEYHYIDQEYAQKVDDEKLTSKLAALFAGLTVFISCLGLFGLAAYMAENRIKEIGVRKILGASVKNLVLLMSKEFVRLVILAILIGSPVAWIVCSSWLKNYPFHTEISAWIFIAAGMVTVAIALLTVSVQAIKAALSNPVKSLRTE